MNPRAGKRAHNGLWPGVPARRSQQSSGPVNGEPGRQAGHDLASRQLARGAEWQHGSMIREAHTRIQRKQIAGVIVIAALVVITVILTIELVPVPFGNAPSSPVTPQRAGSVFSASQPGTISASSSQAPVQGATQAGTNPANGTVHLRPSSIGVETGDQPGIVRLVVPIIDVDAPVVVKSLDGNQAMESPDQPFEVAWYDFSGVPGNGGNVIFAGHLDFQDAGPAVFWDLDVLTAGNTIAVYLEDGTRYEYQVTSVETFVETEAPIQEIVAPTSVETITLITCAGSFDETSQSYDERLIVRGERIPETTP